jgi:uncharacterized damage-inducible protein DinB
MPHRTLLDLLRGRGAHADPVACLEGLSPEDAGRRLADVEHTIWQLVWHMNYWMEYELVSIEGPEASYPPHARESWPERDAPASAAEWREEVYRFQRQVDGLGEWARRAIIENSAARVAHAERGETVQDVLWQMVAHNSYHTGQIVLLRRAFGLWPPPGGGDTW